MLYYMSCQSFLSVPFDSFAVNVHFQRRYYPFLLPPPSNLSDSRCPTRPTYSSAIPIHTVGIADRNAVVKVDYHKLYMFFAL